MKKNFKRFIGVILSLVLCFSMSTMAMAAEVETDNAENEVSVESTEVASTYATTVGSMVFSLNNFGNSSGTALKSQGTQGITFSQQPTLLTYIALPANGGTGSVWLRFGMNGQVKLTADGKPHTVSIYSMALPTNSNVNVTYTSASTPLVSISLVFSR